MNKIFTDDLNKIPVPNEKVKAFELVKIFFDLHEISTPIKYVAFDDPEYDVIVGSELFNTNESNDPIFEFCFSCGEALLTMNLREAK